MPLRRAPSRSRRRHVPTESHESRRRCRGSRGRPTNRCRRPSGNGGQEAGASGEGIVAVSLATRFAHRNVSPGAVVLAAAIPILFLHVSYQPGLAVGFGSTTINAYLSDFAVLAVVIAALAEGKRRGLSPLAPGTWLWIALALFLAWMFVEVGLGHHHAAAYSWRTHGVTAAKFAEYSLLAPSGALLLCGSRHVLRGDVAVRRLAVVAAAALMVLGGAIAIRGTDLEAFAHFLGAKHQPKASQAKVQTYAHRTLLAWIGWQIWKGHPVTGVGWEGSAGPVTFEPYLPAAHRHFRSESPVAFPSAAPDRRYGVQSSWVRDRA